MSQSQGTTVERGLTRRSFLKTTGAALGAAAACGALEGAALHDLAYAEEAPETGEQVFNCSCRSNCMGACGLLAHVRDGKLVKLEQNDLPDPRYTGCCLKGLSYIERIYGPMRVQYPMRRVGERGAGEWERISWEEAIEELASHIKAAADEFGPQSVAFNSASGNYGYAHGIFSPFARVAGCLGATKTAVGYDYAAGHGIDRVLGTGDWYYCNEPLSVLDASMIIVWGTNPVLAAPHMWRWIQWAKEKGAHVLTIDPIKSATAHRSSEYLPVLPGGDGYLALAMSNYIIEKDLVDWEFLKTKSNAAFLVREDTGKHLRKSDYVELPVDPKTEKPEPDDFYVWDNAANGIVFYREAQDPALEGTFTTDDGVTVTTSYSLLKEQLSQYTLAEAAHLTGLSEEQIVALAERIAAEEAVSVNITYGLDHYVNGYLNTWAIAILMSLTGNFAKPGAGFTGVFTGMFGVNIGAAWAGVPGYKGANSSIPQDILADIFATQQLEGKPFPMKVLVSHCSNPLGNLGGQNEFLEKVLPNMDYWAVVDLELNDSSNYADLVLPCSSWYEVEDFRMAYNNPYLFYQEKAIEPLYESKPDAEIAWMLGKALGLDESFPGEWDFDAWANAILSSPDAEKRGITLERLREEKVIHAVSDDPSVPVVRGLTVPFPTEGGLVRLYTENPKPRLDWGQDLSEREPYEHLVYYRDPEEAGVDSPLAEKYPLVYLQEHARWRTHGQWGYVNMLRELDPEPLAKVSRADAEARGVASGDMVEVFNDRGHCVLKCVVDDSFAPGVISIPKGWQRTQFVEGCYQEMTQPKVDPYPAASSFYDARVDFKKA